MGLEQTQDIRWEALRSTPLLVMAIVLLLVFCLAAAIQSVIKLLGFLNRGDSPGA